MPIKYAKARLPKILRLTTNNKCHLQIYQPGRSRAGLPPDQANAADRPRDGSDRRRRAMRTGSWRITGFFRSIFPNDPIFPACLMIEAAGQAIAIWAWHHKVPGLPRLARVQASFESKVGPGRRHPLLHRENPPPKKYLCGRSRAFLWRTPRRRSGRDSGLGGVVASSVLRQAQKTAHRNVLVDLFPVDAYAAGNEPPIFSLGRSSGVKSGRPGKRNRDNAPVGQGHLQCIVGAKHVDGIGINR